MADFVLSAVSWGWTNKVQEVSLDESEAAIR